MSVFYKVYQDNRKKSKNFGMWLARATNLGTKDINDIAAIIQRNCTVKKSDVLAVLSELAEVMSGFLLDGYRVKIDGLGSFKVGLKTTAALAKEVFNASKNIVGARINFTPDAGWDRSSKTHYKTALQGMTVENITTKLEHQKKAAGGDTSGTTD